MMLDSLSKFVIPMEYTVRGVRNVYADAMKHVALVSKVEKRKSRNELVKFCELLDTVARNKKAAAIEGQLVWGGWLRYGKSGRVRCSIEVIAPALCSHEKLRRRAIRQARLMRRSGARPKSYANEGSAVYLIKVGRLRIMLPGDAPAKAIQRALRKVSGFPHARTFLKVSHHGSSTGTDTALIDDLWQTGNRQLAVICPFDCYGLPEDSVLSLLSNSGATTRITGEGKSKAAAELKARLAKMKARNIEVVSSGERSTSHACLSIKTQWGMFRRFAI